MTGAISRGILLKDFEDMTVGQIVDYCKTYNEVNYPKDEKEKKNSNRDANQSDFDRF
ncbi:MAG: hypothetical protein GXZ11_04815 [Tissierellia bacterium]|nr:hypothetical protein [Tissierellia bacterium]